MSSCYLCRLFLLIVPITLQIRVFANAMEAGNTAGPSYTSQIGELSSESRRTINSVSMDPWDDAQYVTDPSTVHYMLADDEKSKSSWIPSGLQDLPELCKLPVPKKKLVCHKIVKLRISYVFYVEELERPTIPRIATPRGESHWDCHFQTTEVPEITRLMYYCPEMWIIFTDRSRSSTPFRGFFVAQSIKFELMLYVFKIHVQMLEIRNDQSVSDNQPVTEDDLIQLTNVSNSRVLSSIRVMGFVNKMNVAYAYLAQRFTNSGIITR